MTFVQLFMNLKKMSKHFKIKAFYFLSHMIFSEINPKNILLIKMTLNVNSFFKNISRLK